MHACEYGERDRREAVLHQRVARNGLQLLILTAKEERKERALLPCARVGPLGRSGRCDALAARGPAGGHFHHHRCFYRHRRKYLMILDFESQFAQNKPHNAHPRINEFTEPDLELRLSNFAVCTLFSA